MKQPNYTDYAFCYDFFELAGYEETEELNIFLDEIFKLNKVKSILDFACGTGAQAVGLSKLGYDVTAVDLNNAMLNQAKQKAGSLKINFLLGDMVTSKIGTFDSVISIFNAIGHLTQSEFAKFLENAYSQLKEKGILVFDIFNLTALSGDAFKEYKNFEKEAVIDDKFVHHLRNCELDVQNSKVIINSRTHIQDGSSEPKCICDCWTLNIYKASDIKTKVKKAGFREINFFGRTGTEFDDKISDTIMAICQK